MKAEGKEGASQEEVLQETTAAWAKHPLYEVSERVADSGARAKGPLLQLPVVHFKGLQSRSSI